MGFNTFPLQLTIPKQTALAAPVSISINSGLPVCYGGSITIPAGAAGLAGIRLTSRSRPIYPVNGGWAFGDGITFTFQTSERLDGPPWILTLEGYNTDDTYPHTIRALIDCGSLSRVL